MVYFIGHNLLDHKDHKVLSVLKVQLDLQELKAHKVLLVLKVQPGDKV
jgi:hypothetical protein